MSRIRKARVLVVAVPVALLVVAGTAFADPVLVESMGLDVWEIGRLEKELQDTNRAGDRLATQLEQVKDLAQFNELILEDVIAGRIELGAAAKRKWELNQHRQPLRDHLDRFYEVKTYEQKVALDLCARVAFDQRGAAQRDRLAREYRAAYGEPLPKE